MSDKLLEAATLDTAAVLAFVRRMQWATAADTRDHLVKEIKSGNLNANVVDRAELISYIERTLDEDAKHDVAPYGDQNGDMSVAWVEGVRYALRSLIRKLTIPGSGLCAAGPEPARDNKDVAEYGAVMGHIDVDGVVKPGRFTNAPSMKWEISKELGDAMRPTKCGHGYPLLPEGGGKDCPRCDEEVFTNDPVGDPDEQ